MCQFHESPAPVQLIVKIATGFHPGESNFPGEKPRPYGDSRNPGTRLREMLIDAGYKDDQIQEFFTMARRLRLEDILGERTDRCGRAGS